MLPDPKHPLSASRIKTAQSCSWLYWANYKLKIPSENNDGARRGTVCHLICEVLGNPRHRHHYDLITEKQDLFASKAIEKLVYKTAASESLVAVNDKGEDNIELIKQMGLNALNYDFFGDSLSRYKVEDHSEQSFDISKNDGEVSYRIRGFIDKLFLYKGIKTALIRDFKTSKSVFEGKDRTNNLQDVMYSLAVRSLFPEYTKTKSQFLFLKFPLKEDVKDSGVLTMKGLTDEQLKDFEAELTEIQQYLDNFTEKDARSNLAAKQGFPSDGSFSGKLMCGFADYEGKLKKDGSKMWACSYKFPRFYYFIYKENGDFHSSVIEEDFSEKLVPEGGSYEYKHYEGCCHFNNC